MALWLGFLASPAFACSPVSGYVRPSNFELVQIAEAIVVARPVAQRTIKARGDGIDETVVTFRVSEALKGGLSGDIAVHRMRIGRTRPSDPGDIRYSHPEGHAGPCNRVTFQKGRDYLLFLQKARDGYTADGHPFSRESEDYAGPQSLWSRTVRAYLDIQREAAPMDQFARLESLRAELVAGKAPGDAARAQDVTDHLGSLSPWKPTPYLLDALERVRQGRPLRYPPRDSGFDEEMSFAHALSGFVMAGLEDKTVEPPKTPARSAAETRILELLIEGKHPDAAAVFEPFLKADAPMDDLSLGLRWLAANNGRRRAYDLIEQRAEAMLGAPAGPDLEDFSWTILRVLEFSGDPPPWRADPHIAQRWPRLAYRLTAFAEAAGRELDFGATLLTLVKVGDYRADPRLTLWVSGHADAITDWAEKEIVRAEVLSRPRGEGWDDPLTLPLRIHLQWHGLSGTEGQPALIAVACAGSPERQLLFREWGAIGSLFSLPTIHRLALTPGMTDADRAVLAEALAAWKARYVAQFNADMVDDSEATRSIARREAPATRDIAPAKRPRCPG